MNLDELPIDDLIIAINHYVTTGDTVGVGMAEVLGDRLRVLIPVNNLHPIDVADFKALLARTSELSGEFDIRVERTDDFDCMSASIGWQIWSLYVEISQATHFARALRAGPGPLGWGSQYESAINH